MGILCGNVEEFNQFCAEHAPVALDIETTGLHIYKDNLRCIAVCGIYSGAVKVWFTDNAEGLVVPQMVAHNVAYDVPFLCAHGAESKNLKVLADTMILAHQVDEEGQHGLKHLCARYFGAQDWALSDVATAADDALLPYVIQDVTMTAALYKLMVSKLEDHPGKPYEVMRMVLYAQKALLDMEYRGIPVELEDVRRLQLQLDAQILEIEDRLNLRLPESIPAGLVPANGRPKWGSTNLTRWMIYDHMGETPTRVGKPTKAYPEGAPSVAAKVLAAMPHNPVAVDVLELQKAKKLRNAFTKPIIDKAVDGRVYTSYRVTGTVTGRLACASPGPHLPGINAQQIPRDKRCRRLFKDRFKVWVEADFSQLELRVAAFMAQEKAMLNLFAEGGDIHAHMAEKLAGKGFTKEHRSMAKAVNFGFLYGMSAQGFLEYAKSSYGLDVSYDEAVDFRKKFFQAFPGLQGWYEGQHREALRLGGVLNLFGRFRHLPDVYARDDVKRALAFRQAVNAPVQSTGSDLMLLSLGEIVRSKEFREAGGELVNTVHDSVEFLCPDVGCGVFCGGVVKRIMESVGDGVGLGGLVKCDVVVADCWGGDEIAIV